MIDKIIVIILDGFGIGKMPDANFTGKMDTFGSLLSYDEDLYLPNLEALGLMNAFGRETLKMKFKPDANYGKIKLLHDGADTFYGHQEMMGTLPRKVGKKTFSESIDKVYNVLKEMEYDVKYIGEKNKILLVNNCIAIGDNIETDVGLAYNVTSSFEYVSFEKILEVGKIVRKNTNVPRIIVFGGEDVELINLISSIHEKKEKAVGVSAPESGVYNKGYKVMHMGYGIDPNVQAPTILGKNGVPVTLIGKVADIVENKYGNSISAVDTEVVMKEVIKANKENSSGFICANVQETDLSGHDENPKRYIEKLKVVDKYLSKIKDDLSKNALLVITADHGNDPLIGHGKHTREYVPFLLYNEEIKCQKYGIRESLSDIGATVVKILLNECLTENGDPINISN